MKLLNVAAHKIRALVLLCYTTHLYFKLEYDLDPPSYLALYNMVGGVDSKASRNCCDGRDFKIYQMVTTAVENIHIKGFRGVHGLCIPIRRP